MAAHTATAGETWRSGGGFGASIAGSPITITDAGLANEIGVLSSTDTPPSSIFDKAGMNCS